MLDELNMYAVKQEQFLSVIKSRQLAWYEHITRHDSLSNTILQETINGSRKRGGQRKTWIDNIKEWTGLSVFTLLHVAEKREQRKTICGDASALTSLRSTDRVLMMMLMNRLFEYTQQRLEHL
jgi:hypothetical protein